MTDFETKEPLSNISDSSFIILGQGSLPSSINTDSENVEFSTENQNTFAVFEPKRLSSGKNTPSRFSDGHIFLEDDIQEKLKQLVRENYQLKETLSQNNLAIKSQLDTFYMWQQEVLKTHEAHKTKFMETKDLILELRTENLNLKKQLVENFRPIGEDYSYIEQINKKFDVCNEYSLQLETDKFKNMNESLANKNEILEMENKKLKEKLKGAEEEVLKLNGIIRQRKQLEHKMTENKFLKQEKEEFHENSVESLSHGFLPNSEARAQINNLLEQLDMERSKVSKLKEELKKGNEMYLLHESKKINESMRNLDDFSLPPECQNQKQNTLQSWVNLEEEVSGNPKDDLFLENEVPTGHMRQEEKTFKEQEKRFQDLKDQFQKLLKDYKALQEQLTLIENKDFEANKYKNEVSSLSQQLRIKEEELLLKQQECDKLKEENKKLNLECEEIACLKVQVEIYQNDLKDEISDREKISAEKNQLAEQIKYLKSRLEALEKEEPGESESFFRPHKGKKRNYICPKCMFSFSDVQRCQEHVEECLNVHFYP